jgi:DNA (cytosine-5)-methyltransferase 1
MSLSFIELFSGAGGMSLGLKNAGLESVGAVEADRFAAETYRSNFPNVNFFESDIRSFSAGKVKAEFSGVDLIAAGPPCQGFSVAGPSQYGKIDERNFLIFEVLRFLKLLSPKMFIVENVKGILSGKLTKEKLALNEFVSSAKSLGYFIEYHVLQAADFGAPQWRERVFIIGSRDKAMLPVFDKSGLKRSTGRWTSVGQAISDLPILRSGEAWKDGEKNPLCAKSNYQTLMRKDSTGLFNHITMNHTKRLVERFKMIPQGGSLVDVPAEHGQRTRNGHGLDVKKRFKMNNQRLDPAKVSTAITASFQSNFVHPDFDRNLTAREGARIQTFPDNFIFHGPRTLMSKNLLIREGREDEIGLSQYNQIGNAVPPLLAQGVGEAILDSK